ncbi:unnamed protein product [Rotaria socialis]|uniref:Uncharacterized protein n=1 Tax=Rotaria socialis TaxID=392032 RepID=A0A817U0Q6_9BILA|nr:unnamed protein product [Rotaria socialis]CAF3324210.1 unnamed protein product [Rotaria socialis]CAF3555205.1 unnamed protein product [Rotaria socialis]CAF4204736.1 unnamed protein product [Rotaria socialis]CAF4348005.1 unnamed protein product [Rotaria socialis]
MDGLEKKLRKCHQGYNRPYPGAAESSILQKKLQKLVNYGLRGKRKMILKRSNDNNSSRTYYLKKDNDSNTNLYVKISNNKKVKKQGQILQLLDRRKEISVATDLFLNLLFYSTNLASAASIEHILKSKQLEVSTKKIQSIHTCIAQHVHSEPIYEQIEITDDESDIEEFDPMLFSSPSNSINNSDNENPTQILEARMSASKQARSKETNIVTQTDLIQLTYDVINEESSTTNNEDGLNLNFMFNNEQSVTILT